MGNARVGSPSQIIDRGWLADLRPASTTPSRPAPRPAVVSAPTRPLPEPASITKTERVSAISRLPATPLEILLSWREIRTQRTPNREAQPASLLYKDYETHCQSVVSQPLHLKSFIACLVADGVTKLTLRTNATGLTLRLI
jgi:hypothetical protein